MRYHNITKDDMLNGAGLRVVLWVAGCTHACEKCQNPQTWDINGGIPFDRSAKDELYAELEKDYIDGITLSGGDPLHPANQVEISNLIYEIKSLYPNKTIWLYTGFLWEDIKSLPYIAMCDVVVDGEFEYDLFDPKLHWCGSSNQKIINVKESIKKDEIILYDK